MARYVDGYVLPLPKRNVAAYKKMAKLASKVWKDHGALEYRECIGEDLNTPCGVSFAKLAKCKKGETVVFAYVVYRSRGGSDEPWNLVTLCRFHHQCGEHGGLMQVRGTSPLGLVWRLGRPEMGVVYSADLLVSP